MDFKVGPIPVVIFGYGKRNLLLDFLRDSRKTAVVITSPGMVRRGHYSQLVERLQSENLVSKIYSFVTPEPSLEDVDSCLDSLKGLDIHAVVGIGGGSVLDLTKVVGARLGVTKIVLPTMAGTGSEVTSGAVMKNAGRKRTFKDRNFMPGIAIIDPEFTLTVPTQWVVSTGLDAFAHATECFGSRNSNVLTDMVASKAIELVEANFEKALAGDLEAKSNMALGSLLAGIAFGTAGTSLGHGLSYPLANRGLPHSLAVSVVLPYALEFNGHLLWGEFVRKISRGLFIPEIPGWDIPVMVEEVLEDRRHLDNNPQVVTQEDIRNIFERLEETF